MDIRMRDRIPNYGQYKDKERMYLPVDDIIEISTGGKKMKTYTNKQIKELEKNRYVYRVTKHKLYYTAKFKEEFWISYQAGNSPRNILSDFGFDLTIFGQKQIDSLVQRIKKEALSGDGFSEGENRQRRTSKRSMNKEELPSPSVIKSMQHELLYLQQEVEFLKKIIIADNLRRKNKRRGN